MVRPGDGSCNRLPSLTAAVLIVPLNTNAPLGSTKIAVVLARIGLP